MAQFVEPRIGRKLLDVYSAQKASGVTENYSIEHLDNYIKYATLVPIPPEVLQKGRHRQDAGHDDCTSCHFCRQCTEDKKPRCHICRKCFCGPCLANRFGQNAAEMVQQGAWTCPVCLDLCNCSGANCRRAQLGLEPTASLIHEAQAFGYSSVRACVPLAVPCAAAPLPHKCDHFIARRWQSISSSLPYSERVALQRPRVLLSGLPIQVGAFLPGPLSNQLPRQVSAMLGTDTGELLLACNADDAQYLVTTLPISLLE